VPIQELLNARLRYELRGRGGDPTVLIHGSWVDHRTWDLVIPGLAQSLDVLSYDRRGHGESTGAPRTRPVADDAADLGSLLEARDHFPAHVVAHSYGGAVALELASERPELVRSLVLHEPPFLGLLANDPATASEGEFLLGELHRLTRRARSGDREGAIRGAVEAFTLEPGAWERLAPSLRDGFVRYAERWLEEVEDPMALAPERKLLSDLLVPALLTYGTQSPGFLRRITEIVARELPNSAVQSIPDAGHVPHVTRPEQYVGLLLTFLVERNVPVT